MSIGLVGIGTTALLAIFSGFGVVIKSVNDRVDNHITQDITVDTQVAAVNQAVIDLQKSETENTRKLDALLIYSGINPDKIK